VGRADQLRKSCTDVTWVTLDEDERFKMAQIIDGKAIAATIRAEVKAAIETIRQERGVDAPGLAVVIVGERKDSQTYVRLKEEAAKEVGMQSTKIELPADIPQERLVEVVRELNSNPSVHGILVQLPLPSHIDESEVLDQISPQKDVDGLHPLNVGLMHSKKRPAYHLPCTPLGCIELLKRSGVQIAGKHAVVVGRSNIVGLPVSHLLLQENATVTIVHSKTVNPAETVKRADIVVSAAGQAGLVRGDWIKPGAAVIDVGTNAVTDTTKKAGFRLVGDVNFDEAKEVAGFITPVPGGVGPMTIAMLLSNTLNSFKRANSVV
jgi:5,10-methylene-tetrahydrofolate dehydrogenase/methenyl tetrahydrofolate cyclohydrolase